MSEEQRKVFDGLMGLEYSKYCYDHFMSVRKKVKDRITSLDEMEYEQRGEFVHHIQKKPTISGFDGDIMNVVTLSGGKLKKVDTSRIYGQMRGSMKSIPVFPSDRKLLRWNYGISIRMQSEFMLFATYVEVFYGWRRYIPSNDGPHYAIIFNIWEFDNRDIDSIIGLRERLCKFVDDPMFKYIVDNANNHENKELPVARGLVRPYIWNLV